MSVAIAEFIIVILFLSVVRQGISFRVTHMFGYDFWVSGGEHNTVLKDVPVIAWLIPSVRDNQGTCEVDTEDMTLVLELDTWKLTTKQAMPSTLVIKRACSDPDRISVLEASIVFIKLVRCDMSCALMTSYLQFVGFTDCDMFCALCRYVCARFR